MLFFTATKEVRSWADLDFKEIYKFKHIVLVNLGRFKDLAPSISIKEAQLIADGIDFALFLFLDSAPDADPAVASMFKQILCNLKLLSEELDPDVGWVIVLPSGALGGEVTVRDCPLRFLSEMLPTSSATLTRKDYGIAVVESVRDMKARLEQNQDLDWNVFVDWKKLATSGVGIVIAEALRLLITYLRSPTG